MAAKRTSFSCVGTVDDSSYHMAVAVLKSAEALGYVDERDLECTPLLEPEFDKYMMDAKPRLGGSAFAHSTSPFICMVMSFSFTYLSYSWTMISEKIVSYESNKYTLTNVLYRMASTWVVSVSWWVSFAAPGLP
jgi:hypothetical protein